MKEKTDVKRQLIKIKKRIKILAFTLLFLLLVSAAVFLYFRLSYNDGDPAMRIAQISYVAANITIFAAFFLTGNFVTKKHKSYVEKYAGTVYSADSRKAAELLGKWKKCCKASKKRFFPDFRKKKYPFGEEILLDLGLIQKGFKVETAPFYASLKNTDYGEEVNALLNEISELVARNSYTLD